MTKLTIAEFDDLSSQDAMIGNPCACMGPQNGEEYCPCSMRLLNMLDEEGQRVMKNRWRRDGYLPASEEK